MPLYLVTHHCPNGNTVSRVVCNISAPSAIDEREAEMGINDAQAEGFEVECVALADPDGGRARRWEETEERQRIDGLMR
jgi:hypothetical protein